MTQTFSIIGMNERRSPMLALDSRPGGPDREAVRRLTTENKFLFLDTSLNKLDRCPPIGPTPLTLSRKEVDELYNLLEVLQAALNTLQIKYVVMGGTLLGAVRSESFLFNDDDVDIAILDDGESYTRMKERLPQLLDDAAQARNEFDEMNVRYTYHKRPRITCDRLTSTAAPRVWLDVFVLRKYNSFEDLNVFLHSEGVDCSPDRVEKIHAGMQDAEFPVYHYDNCKAIELWPHKYMTTTELSPTVNLNFGHLVVQGPQESIGVLRRFYGSDCFTHYTADQRKDGTKSNTNSWELTTRLPLNEEHYSPVQHSRSEKRIWSTHCRQALESKLTLQDEKNDIAEDEPVCASPPRTLGSMARTKSLFAMSDQPDPSLILAEDVDAPIEPGSTEQFGAEVRLYVGDCPDAPTFDQGLRAVLEPHIRKARVTREMSRSQSNFKVEACIASTVGVPYTCLREERRFLFDECSHPLHEALADTLGVDDLSMIHESPIEDKRRLLEPLLHASSRRRFHECYDNFVTSFCIPLLHSIAMTKNVFHSTSPDAFNTIRYRYQAFPCIRVVRPGERSIGPHCDTANGHSIGSLNFHIPLTAVIGTDALYTETHPGREDWHPLVTKSVGLGFLFDGARCLHFTLENTTARTSVSIDFRVSIYRKDGDHTITENYNTGLCTRAMLEDRFSRAGPGYYDEACIDTGSVLGSPFDSSVARKDFPDLFEPDQRVGFPFSAS